MRIWLAGLALGGMALLGAPVAAQDNPASAAETDPAAMGWMRGAPPPPNRLVRWDDGSFYQFPRTRWSFSNMRMLFPTADLSRGNGPQSALPENHRDDLDRISFVPLGGSEAMRWDEALQRSYADAILILHRGTIVYERYFGVTGRQTPHMSFSMTKSYVGTVAAMLMAEGLLDENEMVSHYIPELADSAFGDATVRQVADMTTAIHYVEDYTDPQSEVFAYAIAGGIFARPEGYAGPDGFYSYLPTLRKEGEHGAQFTYRSVNTEVLGWLIARVTGRSAVEVIQERIWGRLGAEANAYMMVDSHGTGWAAGGLNATLRDHARFGEMMRRNGNFNGHQIVPEAVVEQIRQGGNPEDFAPAGYATLPGWSYRDQWWISDNGAFAARGVHGQTIYIDPAAEMVIVRLASHPMAANAHIDPVSLPAYQAIADHLARQGN
ncbi:MAG: serine hydrolase domain-containing protein [Parasphingopyxis sp.]